MEIEMKRRTQYFFKNDKGEISLSEMEGYVDGEPFFEARCVKGELFEGVERFKEMEIAVKWVQEMLK